MNTQIQSGKKERVNFLVPQELVTKAHDVAKEYHFTLSDFFRQALARFIEELEREKSNREIEAACKDYYDFNRKFSEEWASFETRIE